MMNKLPNEISMPSGYPKDYMMMCTLGTSQESKYDFERTQLKRLSVKDKLHVILKNDYRWLLDEYIADGTFYPDEEFSQIYEELMYDLNLSKNETSGACELMILNHDLEQHLVEKNKTMSRKI